MGEVAGTDTEDKITDASLKRGKHQGNILVLQSWITQTGAHFAYAGELDAAAREMKVKRLNILFVSIT